MDAENLHDFPKLTRTVERVPEEQRGELLWALACYGTYGVEPNLEYPLDMAFEALREDIDNSRRNRGQNKGGRPPKKPWFRKAKTRFLKRKRGFLKHENRVSSGGTQTNPSQYKQPSQ